MRYMHWAACWYVTVQLTGHNSISHRRTAVFIIAFPFQPLSVFEQRCCLCRSLPLPQLSERLPRMPPLFRPQRFLIDTRIYKEADPVLAVGVMVSIAHTNFSNLVDTNYATALQLLTFVLLGITQVHRAPFLSPGTKLHT